MAATVVGPSFKVSGWTPPGWTTASPAQRTAFWEAVRPMVLKAKDVELKKGLDRHGKPMAALAASTVKHRKSAMGPADPGAPPLQPAHGLSRTRSLLVAKATLSGVVCWWIVDKHTGASWGEILKHHRNGSRKKHLPKRDVIGLSPESREKVRVKAFAWWDKHVLGLKHYDFGVGSAKQAAEAEAGGKWSGWHTAEEAEAQFKASGGKKVAVGKFDFSGVFKAPPQPAAGPAAPSPVKPTGPKPAAAKPKKAKPTGKAKTSSSFTFNPPVPKPPPPAPAPAPTLADLEARAKAAAVKAAAAEKAAKDAEAAYVDALNKTVASPNKKTLAASKAAYAKHEAAEKAADEAKKKADDAAAKAAAAPNPQPKVATPGAAAQTPPAPTPPKAKKKAAAKPAAAHSAATPPATAVPWPSDPSGLVDVKKLGGSTGAMLVEDPATGRRYVLKRGGNADHLRSEAQADALYRTMGADVPESRIYEVGGKPVKLAEFVEGKSLGELRKSDPVAFEKACRELQKHFAADALLGNWDVVGMGFDNVLVADDGRILRIDNGGSLGFRAQGSPKTAKQWNPDTVNELNTMRRKRVSEQNHEVFTPLHDSDLKPGLAAVVAKRREILDAAADPALKKTLAGRLDVLERWTKPAPGFHADGFKPTPESEFQRFETNAERLAWIDAHYGDGLHSKWWATLSKDEIDAVKQYSGAYYTPTNDWLRDPAKAKEKGVDKRIADLDSALAKIPTPNGTVMYRGIQDAKPVYAALRIKGRDDLRVGMDLIDMGFGSSSPNILKAWEGGSGANWEGQLQLEIRLPAGTHGAYFGKRSSVPTEEEFLLDRGFKFRIIDIGPKWLTVEAVKVQTPSPAKIQPKPKRGGKKP